MYNWINKIAAISLLAFTHTSNASILNGDFQTCDLTGWQTDSATLGSPGYDTDFNVIDTGAGNCAVEVGIDLLDTQEFIANTLFTDLDLSVADGFGVTLSFDYDFHGEEVGLTSGRDYWLAALGDGTGSYFDENGDLGVLFEQSSYQSGAFSVDLSSDLFNQAGWTLEFQLLAGSDVNFLGSLLTIDNVTLETFALPTSVSEPTILSLMALGFVGLVGRRKVKN